MPENTTSTSTETRGPGRPKLYSEAAVERLCEIIRRLGLADSPAAVRAGLSASTLFRWKAEHDGLADRLSCAREEFRERQLAIIFQAATRDGRPDWRAAAWLLERVFPEDYSRRRYPSPDNSRYTISDEDEAYAEEMAFQREWAASPEAAHLQPASPSDPSDPSDPEPTPNSPTQNPEPELCETEPGQREVAQTQNSSFAPSFQNFQNSPPTGDDSFPDDDEESDPGEISPEPAFQNSQNSPASA